MTNFSNLVFFNRVHRQLCIPIIMETVDFILLALLSVVQGVHQNCHTFLRNNIGSVSLIFDGNHFFIIIGLFKYLKFKCKKII